ncbi:MAG: Cna B-type domain-containing protein [Firmicutes bacterium]|nr:Cna B-type domain-containing protein [Bacillota bacterium]
MNNRIHKFLLCLLLAMLCLAPQALHPESAHAADRGSLLVNLVPTLDSVNPKGVHLKLYRIAQGNPLDKEADFTPDFDGCGVDISDYTKDPAGTIAATDRWIKETDPEALGEKVTGSDGMVSFTGLSDGIYYLMHVNPEDPIAGSYKVQIKSTVITIPYLEDGSPSRDVISNVKCRILREDTEEKQITVEKHWQDDNDKKGTRPARIQVALYCDDKKVETVWLDAGNNWQHTFTGLKADGEYTAREVKVPSGYQMKVTREDTSIVITNTLDQTPAKGVSTGDTSPLLPAAAAMTGSVLILAGIGLYRRKQKKMN